MIPYSTQKVNKSDIQEVIKTLKSPFLTQGPKVSQFEKALAKKVNAKYVAVTNSATSALHISCMALGFKKMISFGQHQIHLLQHLIVLCI